MQQLTIKGLLDTPTAATCPKGVTTGFACPNVAKPAPWKEKQKNINISKQCSKSSLLQLPAKIKGKFELQNQQDWSYLNMIRNVSVKHCGSAFCLFSTVHNSSVPNFYICTFFNVISYKFREKILSNFLLPVFYEVRGSVIVCCRHSQIVLLA